MHSLEQGHKITYTNSIVNTQMTTLCTSLWLDNGLILTCYPFTFVWPLHHMCRLDAAKSTTIGSYCAGLKEATSISLLCLVKWPNIHMCPTIGLMLIFQCDIFSIWVWLRVWMHLRDFKCLRLFTCGSLRLRMYACTCPSICVQWCGTLAASVTGLRQKPQLAPFVLEAHMVMFNSFALY